MYDSFVTYYAISPLHVKGANNIKLGACKMSTKNTKFNEQRFG